MEHEILIEPNKSPNKEKSRKTFLKRLGKIKECKQFNHHFAQICRFLGAKCILIRNIRNRFTSHIFIAIL